MTKIPLSTKCRRCWWNHSFLKCTAELARKGSPQKPKITIVNIYWVFTVWARPCIKHFICIRRWHFHNPMRLRLLSPLHRRENRSSGRWRNLFKVKLLVSRRAGLSGGQVGRWAAQPAPEPPGRAPFLNAVLPKDQRKVRNWRAERRARASSYPRAVSMSNDREPGLWPQRGSRKQM